MLGRIITRFNIMAVGPLGSGRSSFFNYIIGEEIISEGNSERINVYTLDMEEVNVKKVALIETPGFGQRIDDEELQASIIDYIRDQYDLFVEEEAKIIRNAKYEDTRIHLLLYFIPATGCGMKPRDVAFLKKVCSLVNVVPILSKADGLTIEELKYQKGLIRDQLEHFEISIFQFQKAEMDVFVPPYHVIFTDSYETAEMRRESFSGVIEVEDTQFSCLKLIKEMILRTQIWDLLESTILEFYEKYRVKALEKLRETGR